MTDTAAPKKQSAPKKRASSDVAKNARLEGRRQAQTVRIYLEALKASQAPKRRGRKRTPESIRRRLEDITVELSGEPDPLRELKLLQERHDLGNELVHLEQRAPDPSEFEDEFVKVAKSYSERQGVTRVAWRELGVPASVLKRAGL
jgi:hypothetical protein